MATLVWRYAGFPDSDDPGNTQEGAWGSGDDSGNGDDNGLPGPPNGDELPGPAD